MDKFILNTPVAFLIFNRPETTIKVFEEIRKSKPKKLLVVADGPRKNKKGDEENCIAARKIINQVDWECEILKNYSEINLGCKKRISSGISWVFENVEEAIFLEDDCLPDQSFFRYCQELLEYYRNDSRIMTISGNNFQKQKVSEYSYYFSSYSHIWGWASWKRAWQKYDVEMKLWPEVKKNNFFKYLLPGKKTLRHWTEEFDRVYNKKLDTWDFQLLFACWVNSGLTILPEVNLVSNIGFGTDATHTTKTIHKTSGISVKEILFPLKHPPYIMRNSEADKYEEDKFMVIGFPGRVKKKLKSLI